MGARVESKTWGHVDDKCTLYVRRLICQSPLSQLTSNKFKFKVLKNDLENNRNGIKPFAGVPFCGIVRWVKRVSTIEMQKFQAKVTLMSFSFDSLAKATNLHF